MPLHPCSQCLADDDEAEAPDSLYAFVGTADHDVYAQSCHVYRHSAEAAHSIDDECLAVSLDYSGNGFQRFECACGGLAV